MAATIRGILVKQFGGPEVLKYVTNIPRPGKPVAKQLMLQVKTAGVNPVDTYIVTGNHTIVPELPFTPGNDGAGIVEEVGEHVNKFKVGDRVYWCRSIGGSYKELVISDEMHTFPLHSSLSFLQGAALGIPYFTAYRACVTKGRVKAGERVLVHGASGAVGIACCQIAHHLGATVIGTAGSDEGLQLVKQNGADTVLNHSLPGYLDALKADGAVDVVVEMLANINLERDLELCSANARVVLVGSRGKIEITPRLAMTVESTILGVALFRATPGEWQEMGDFMTKGQEQGWLRPVVGLQFPLDQAAEAQSEVMQHKQSTKGKIVLNIS